MKRVLSLIMATLLIFGCFAMAAFAQGTDAVTVKMMNFNVAGLPKFGGGADGEGDTRTIADYINKSNADIVAVQEDFWYHSTLVDNLNGYSYKSNFSGSIPGGDGLNVFTKNMPIYNEFRQQWNAAYGDIAEGDTLTPKGFMHTVIDVGNGIYVDFYNLHADAFDTDGSKAARESNYRQVAALVQKNYDETGRPFIITGDFNHFLHTTPEVNSNMYKIFHEELGTKDAWVELHNGGDYFNFTQWSQTGVSYWGNWDSVEKYLYKDGVDVKVEALDFEYNWVTNSDGARVSDHAAAVCTFSFTKTAEFTEKDYNLKVVGELPLRNFLNTVMWVIKDLLYVLMNFDQVIALL